MPPKKLKNQSSIFRKLSRSLSLSLSLSTYISAPDLRCTLNTGSTVIDTQGLEAKLAANLANESGPWPLQTLTSGCSGRNGKFCHDAISQPTDRPPACYGVSLGRQAPIGPRPDDATERSRVRYGRRATKCVRRILTRPGRAPHARE